ncbi:MAG TPA: hypothetical protein VGQ69_10630 [Gemmatimonadales bacterium]|nr:hypothetical protein [Gemmatimonadales bacterium]
MARASVARVALLGVLLAACSAGDSRFKGLTRGISRDSVLKVLGDAKPERLDAFLVNSQFIEAFYFAPAGADSGSTPERDLSPVVVVDGKLAGWGWEVWDSIAGQNNIPLKK